MHTTQCIRRRLTTEQSKEFQVELEYEFVFEFVLCVGVGIAYYYTLHRTELKKFWRIWNCFTVSLVDIFVCFIVVAIVVLQRVGGGFLMSTLFFAV